MPGREFNKVTYGLKYDHKAHNLKTNSTAKFILLKNMWQ